MFRHIYIVFLLSIASFQLLAQNPENDACNNAIPLCPSVELDASNVNATSTVCPDCEDDFNFCFQPAKTIWYKFETNETGGDVNITLSNLLFNLDPAFGQFLQASVLSTTVPCNSSAFKSAGFCSDTIRNTTTLFVPNLNPKQVYYLVIGGGRTPTQNTPAEAIFKLSINGPGIDRVPPILSVAAPDTLLCPFQPAYFSAYLSNCTDTSTFTWFLNQKKVAVTKDAFFTFGDIRKGDTITAKCSCFKFCTVDLSFNLGPIEVDPIEVNAGDNRFVISGDKVILKGSVTNVTKINWFPPNEVTLPNALSTTTYPTKTTVYSLTGDNGKCKLTDYVTIFVNDEIVIPKTFSPNGDGTNDTWEIKGISIFPDTRVIIIDRWGQEVADIISYNKEKAWDGTNRGKPLPLGSYFYTIDFNDEAMEIVKGVVTIIR